MVTIVIPHYQTPDIIRLCLRSIRKFTPQPYKVIVVDIDSKVLSTFRRKNRKVFQEGFRVLRPGGRMMVSDMVLLSELPESIKESITAFVGCLSGAILKKEYIGEIEMAGFQDVTIIDESSLSLDSWTNDPTSKKIAESFNVPQDKVEGIIGAVVSVRAYTG